MSKENIMEFMQTLDDAWNALDWETFSKRHSHDTVVKWPGGGVPTEGISDQEAEAREFSKTFSDNRVENRPYKVFFSQGDWTCSMANFTILRGILLSPVTLKQAA